MRFAIIGAGMSGILAAIKLKLAGHENITVYEKAGRIGGTWRDNRYPGLACDVPAHAYTYEFAPNPEWSAFLVGGPEIQAYFERVVDEFGIRPLIRFRTEIAQLQWGDGCWQITTRDGHADVADVVIAATGVLHHPNVPALPGLETFAGISMHTAQWDTAVDLDGLRIGVVGGGSTGVQMVAHLGLEGRSVTHFQRTPQWIMPFPNRLYSEEEKASFRADVAAIDAVRYDPEFLANVDRFTSGIADKNSPQIAQIEAICRDFLDAAVNDPDLRNTLTPEYRAACKRLIYSSTYYEAVQKPNVSVVTDGIGEIVPDGVIDGSGRLHRLDLLALATGFHADRFIRPAQVTGIGGLRLDDVWGERCAAYMGIAVPGFPNLFFLNGPTSPVGNFSLIDIAERQWAFVAQLLGRLSEDGGETVEVRRDAFDAYETARVAQARNTIFASGCKSWYLDSSGIAITWPWTYADFRERIAKPDAAAFAFQ